MRLERFKSDPACRVFLSTDAGGTGLNLQTADTVVNLELPWNPAVLEQRIARVHRMGQSRPVRVVNFVTRGHHRGTSPSDARSQAGALCRRLPRGTRTRSRSRPSGPPDSSIRCGLSSTARRVASVSLRWKHRRADHDRRPRVWLRASRSVLHFSRNQRRIPCGMESRSYWKRHARRSRIPPRPRRSLQKCGESCIPRHGKSPNELSSHPPSK